MSRVRLAAIALSLLLPSLGLAACGGAESAADCLCATGRGGETLWCVSCAKGCIDGQPTTDKAAVDRALAKLVEARALEKGLAGNDVDRILSDIAAGVVKKPTCRCEACAKGEPHEHASEESASHEGDASAESEQP